MKAIGLLERIPNSRWTKPWLNSAMLEATPSRLVHTAGSLKVKIYDSFESPPKAQVLLFPSLINRPYILDLGRGRSLIQALLKAGIEVVLFDWGSPTETERDMGLDSLLERRIPAALSSVFANSAFTRNDSRPRTVMGHCLGGDLALLFAAKQAQKVDGVKIDSLVCLTTPIDTKNDALINTWFQIPNWDPRRFAQSFETIPWPLLQFSFQMLRPLMTPRRWIEFAGRLSERDYRESWLQLEIWSNDNISFSTELFKDLLIPMYRDNAMVEKWSQVRELTLPVFSLAALEDHIVPLESAKAIVELMPKAKHDFNEMRGGHIGAVLSKRARESVWPKMIDFIMCSSTTSAMTSACSKTPYRIDRELRASPSRKSAATSGEVSTLATYRDPREFSGNSGAHQSSAQVQT